MEEEIERKRKEYREIQNERKRELQKTIYKNSSFFDKLKIRVRMFFESSK
jgi:hypothetical protein